MKKYLFAMIITLTLMSCGNEEVVPPESTKENSEIKVKKSSPKVTRDEIMPDTSSLN